MYMDNYGNYFIDYEVSSRSCQLKYNDGNVIPWAKSDKNQVFS